MPARRFMRAISPPRSMKASNGRGKLSHPVRHARSWMNLLRPQYRSDDVDIPEAAKPRPGQIRLERIWATEGWPEGQSPWMDFAICSGFECKADSGFCRDEAAAAPK